jgi:hypothetical protein
VLKKLLVAHAVKIVRADALDKVALERLKLGNPTDELKTFEHDLQAGRKY